MNVIIAPVAPESVAFGLEARGTRLSTVEVDHVFPAASVAMTTSVFGPGARLVSVFENVPDQNIAGDPFTVILVILLSVSVTVPDSTGEPVTVAPLA